MLMVVYLIFNEGYTATSADPARNERARTSAEARLARRREYFDYCL